MKKHYGKMLYTFLEIAVICCLALILNGVYFIFKGDYTVGTLEAAAGAAFIATAVIYYQRRKNIIERYINNATPASTHSDTNALSNIALPLVVLHIDGSILWCNKAFSESFGSKAKADVHLSKVLPNLKWTSILKSSDGISVDYIAEDRNYHIIGDIVKNQSDDKNTEDDYTVYMFFVDVTEETRIKRLYSEERTDIAIINIDNYEEIQHKLEDSEDQQLQYRINCIINDWINEAKGVVKKTDRDRYFALFESRHLEHYVQHRFDVLEKIRQVGEDVHIPITASIGIGVGGDIDKNEEYARGALDMALGRGGDQVAIKDESQYKFYGGRTREYEKSTRVKTRATAIALRDFIGVSDAVFIMGHKGADYDSFGAAMGLQRAVRQLGKKPYLVEMYSAGVENVYTRAFSIPDYAGMFVSTETALDTITQDSLIIIVDTHRPSMLPVKELLSKTHKVVLIDHHRRSTEFISPCSLVYHEPYASSACEMTTEILQYITENINLTEFEVECLYTGILMDTKNFLVKTGVRTFEAASYLRHHGLNTVAVKRLFNVSIKDYSIKADIVKTARVVERNVAVAVTDRRGGNIRVIASQAADEMLNLVGVQGSFVLYPLEDGGVGISGRSYGDLNVQLILETFGGGGHLTVAGAQMYGKTINEVYDLLKQAIHDYFVNEDEKPEK